MLDMTEHACKDSNNPSYVIKPPENGIPQSFCLVNMWRCWDDSTPAEPYASLSSDYSWVTYNKLMIKYVKCFSEFCEMLQQINRTQEGGLETSNL